MIKLTKENVGGTDYSVVGCALSATCASAASDYIKTATLTDGDSISDGMTVVVTFTNGNSAGSAPDVLTIYSSDQVNYFSDAGLTQPFTLAPAGCYSVSYTGAGNVYYYTSWVCLSVGGVTAPLYLTNGSLAGGTLWNTGVNIIVLYAGGKFIICNSGLLTSGRETYEIDANTHIYLDWVKRNGVCTLSISNDGIVPQGSYLIPVGNIPLAVITTGAGGFQITWGTVVAGYCFLTTMPNGFINIVIGTPSAIGAFVSYVCAD